MSEHVSIELTAEFDTAFVELASARASYEDKPRDSARIAALGAARKRLEEARTAMGEERRRLGLDSLWRVPPAEAGMTVAPPTWSVDHGSGA